MLPPVVVAIRVAHLFRLDPVAVFNEPDETAWRLRVAAYELVAHDREQAQKAR